MSGRWREDATVGRRRRAWRRRWTRRDERTCRRTGSYALVDYLRSDKAILLAGDFSDPFLFFFFSNNKTDSSLETRSESGSTREKEVELTRSRLFGINWRRRKLIVRRSRIILPNCSRDWKEEYFLGIVYRGKRFVLLIISWKEALAWWK